MYGNINPFKDDNNALRNEISIQNIIAIANNSMIFQRLDDETKTRLVSFLASYTKGCLDNIEAYGYEISKKER